MPQIKGSAIRGVLKYAKEKQLQGGSRGLVSSLSPEHRAVLAGQVLSSKWYPYPTYAALLHEVNRQLGHGDLVAMHHLGVFAARQESGSVLQLVMNMLSVERVLKMSSMFWKRICDGGRFETSELRADSGVGRLLDFPDVAIEHCHTMTGWIEGMAFAAGAKTVKVEKSRCVHRGDPWCEYRGGWT